MLLAIAFSSDMASATVRQALRREAYDVLKEGVNDSNRDKAAEIILRFQSGILKDALLDQNHWIETWIVPAAIIVTIVFFFRPKTTVGIGKGKNAIVWQKNWIWFVLKFVVWTVVVSTLGLGLIRKFVLG